MPDLQTANKHGTKGQMPVAMADLLHSMWGTEEKVIDPREIKVLGV